MFTEGTFTIGAPIVYKENMRYVGMGKGATVVTQANGTNDNIFEASTTGVSVRGHLTMSDFTINGNKDNNTSGSWYGLFGECYYGRFHNMLFTDCRTSVVALSGFSGNGAIENIFNACTFKDVDTGHIVICSTYATDNHFHNCMFWGSTSTGNYMISSQEWNTIINTCHFYGGTSAGAIRLTGGCKYDKVVNCYIENIDRHGLYMYDNGQDMEDFVIMGNTFTDCGEETNNTYDAIQINGSGGGTATRGVIMGNTIRTGDANAHRYGIYGVDTDYMTVIGNAVEDSGTANIFVEGLNNNIAHNISLP